MKAYEWNIAGNETRIILTTNCNYKCVFCHSEGFDPYTKCSWTPDWAFLKKIIDDVISHGCKDITITGGEPLIHPDFLLKAARHISEKSEGVELTIVTNGSLFKEEWLKSVSRFKNVRFNISLHSADPERYATITAQKHTSLESLASNLILLKPLGIPFKLNCVTLRETMNEESILKILEFARDVGADAVKFIELLIMEQSDAMFSSYISNDSLAKMLPSTFHFSRRRDRRDDYTSDDFFPTVELQKCRCRYGCENCLTETTTCITGNGLFHPCFEYSGKSFDIMGTPLDVALAKGMKEIEKLALRFGKGSPSLVKDIQFTSRHKSVFFRLSSPEVISEILKKSELNQKREYSDYYFTSELITTSSRTVKMRVHHADKKNAKLIISTVVTEKIGPLFVSSRIFQHKEKVPMIEEPDFIVNTMKQLGWSIVGRIKFLEHEYSFGENIFRILNVNGDLNLVAVNISEETKAEDLKLFIDAENMTMIKENINSFYRSLL